MLLGRVINVWLQKAIKGLTYIVWVALSFEVLMFVADLSGRFFFNRPLPASVKMSELIMPYIIFPGLAYTLAKGGHVRVTLLFNRFPQTVQLWCEKLACIIGIVLFSLLTYMGVLHFWQSFLVKEDMLAAIYLPWYVGKFIFPIGTAFLSIQFAMNLFSNPRKLIPKDE